MYVEHTEKGLEFYFPRQRDLYKVDRAPLNMNWTIFLRRMTAVLRVKTQRKRISSHLKNGCPNSSNYTEQADTVGSSSSKTCFVTSIFAPFLRLIIQNRFHLLLKVLFYSKFIAKSTYRLLKRAAAKTTKPIADMTKARHSSMLPGVREDTIAIHTSIQLFRGCRKKVHATNPKGNMGYEQCHFLTL